MVADKHLSVCSSSCTQAVVVHLAAEVIDYRICTDVDMKSSSAN